ncbi:diguanylate cyclase (GGDEF)-like protein/PAS domain S-box-containing protein [Arthrobacter sp. CAN_C5]|nr:diguanylate cyclase (GGDEF)-like protein/PAS domain S-box-containing protein [Arthrobacter sp. CAN_C5]
MGGRPQPVPAPDSYQVLIEGSPDALLALSQQGQVVLINAAAEEMFGYQRSVLVGQHYGIVLPPLPGQDDPDDSPPSSAPGGLLLGKALPVSGRHRGGQVFPVEVRTARLSVGQDEQIVLSVRNVSEQQRHGAELREALSLLNATLESTADGILVVSHEGRIAGSNEQFAAMWGIPARLLGSGDDGQVIGFVLGQLIDPGAFVAKVEELYADPSAESHDTLEFLDGRTFERYSKPQRVDGQVVGRVWSFRDATPRRRAEEQARKALADLAGQTEELRTLAFRDSLTGLANRFRFQDRLTDALSAPGNRSVDVLLLDLDDFKEVNDILGHHAGDQMLVEIGNRLTQCVRATDTVARLGGDEFVALLVDSEDPEAVAARILSSVNRPFLLDGREFQPSVSLGLAGAEGHPAQAPDLLRRADVAMYAAKRDGKNRYMRFHPSMMEALLAHTELEAGLRKAVERDELVLHFQPVVSAADRDVTQVEALVYWRRPAGLVELSEFIATAESGGLINRIGREVLTAACSQLRPWLSGSARRSLAVKVSTVQLREQDFASEILAILAACQISPRQVVLEVSENAFMEASPQITGQLGLLRGHGTRVALDNFGTGYSSLGQLQGLPVDSIKIDRSFVSQLHSDSGTLPILTSMVQLGRNLGLHITAEGIDNTSQARHLLELGCEHLQGSLFSCPRSSEDLPVVIDQAETLIRRLTAGQNTGADRKR